MDVLNVLYSTDSNYAPHAAASIYSLLDNNKEFEKINIHIIDDNISEDSKVRFYDMISQFPNSNLTFYSFENIKSRFNIKETWYTMVGYARLMLSEIIDVDKILYIDCDTIINASLKELWEITLEGYYIGGVQDNPALYARKAIGMSKNDRYINGGIMLINLKKWKEDNLEEKIVKLIEEHNGFVLHHDQGIVNGVCKDYIKILHPKYNTMSQFFLMNAKQIKALYDIKKYYTQDELDEATENPVIIHYISKFYNRPWFENCSHPLKNLYISYLNKTLFEIDFVEGTLKNTVKVRKFVFEHFPFFVYYMMEKILDIRRKIINERQ